MSSFTNKELARLKAFINSALDPTYTDAESNTAFAMARKLVKANNVNPLKFDADGNTDISPSNTIITVSYTVPAEWLNAFITEMSRFAHECKIHYKLSIKAADPKNRKISANQKITIEHSGTSSNNFSKRCTALVQQINDQINKSDPLADLKNQYEDLLRQQDKRTKAAQDRVKEAEEQLKKKEANKKPTFEAKLAAYFKKLGEWCDD